jgi:hypothetical protein
MCQKNGSTWDIKLQFKEYLTKEALRAVLSIDRPEVMICMKWTKE